MLTLTMRPEREPGETFPAAPPVSGGTWAEAREASRDLLRGVNEPAIDEIDETDEEVASEIADLAALLVAYHCVPSPRAGRPEAALTARTILGL